MENGAILNISTTPFYIYMVIMLFVAYVMTKSSKTKYKFELFIIIYYILTGDYNELLTFSLPGISFMEIQPERFLFFTFLFLFARRIWFGDTKSETTWQLPWFKLLLILFVLSVVVSLFTHVERLGLGEVISESQKPINFLLIIYALTAITNEATLVTLGKAIIFAAIMSSLISLVQVGVQPMFLRYGELRDAFGDVLRSNGIFRTERANGFFLLTAMAWVMASFKISYTVKYLLIGLLTAAIFTTFHRMTWLLTCIAMVIYFVKIEQVKAPYIVVTGLGGIALVLAVMIWGSEKIQESDMVAERISGVPMARLGYYNMVLESIGDQPFFGYGDKKNDAYYQGMMKVTGKTVRATGADGGIHSGYFSTMFYYGIPCFLFFTFFVLLTVFYFANLSRYHIFFTIPLMVAVLYLIGNLTNTVLFKTGGTMLMIHIGLGLGALRIKEFFTAPSELKLVSRHNSLF